MKNEADDDTSFPLSSTRASTPHVPRGRFERTHGDVLSGHTGFSACHTPHTTHHTAHTPHHNTRHNLPQHTTTTRPQHDHNTSQHNTRHNIPQHTTTTRPQHLTETETERQRETEKEDGDRKRREKRGEKREDSFSVWCCRAVLS